MLPTINEEKTIGKLVGYLTRNYKRIEVLVVDDGSRDGTKAIVDRISGSNKRVRFFDRHAAGLERGLTASAIDGILRSRTKYAILMDSDLQHPPSKVGEVAEKLIGGNNLVVADRADVTGWSLYRRIISRIFMFVGKVILYLGARETCVDIFSGFFGVERDVFVEVYKKNKRRFVGDGYKVLFDFLKCVDRGTLAIDNTPFVFNMRKTGESKAGFEQGIALIKSFLT